jgi:DNA-binding MarR family transcriptional regulator
MVETSLDEQAYALVEILPGIMQRLFTIHGDDPTLHLPIGQLRVCSILSHGPCTMSTLSKRLGITLSAITQIADRLERTGLVERTAEGDDRRVKTLKLTERGIDMMQYRKTARRQRARQALEHLSEKQRAAVMAGLETLLDAAGASLCAESADELSHGEVFDTQYLEGDNDAPG